MYDASGCQAVQSAWHSYDFHQTGPLSSLWDQSGDFSCLPDPSNPCSGAGDPVYVVNASEAEHVRLALVFGESMRPTDLLGLVGALLDNLLAES